MIEITYESTLEGIKAIVDEAGEDFVYQQHRRLGPIGCRYVHDGKPDCIVGRFLASVGVPLDVLSEYEGRGAEGVLESLQERSFLHFDDIRVRVFLRRLQKEQDAEETWGNALRAALLEVRSEWS